MEQGRSTQTTKPIINNVVDTDNRANRVNNRSTTNMREILYPDDDDVIKGSTK